MKKANDKLGGKSRTSNKAVFNVSRGRSPSCWRVLPGRRGKGSWAESHAERSPDRRPPADRGGAQRPRGEAAPWHWVTWVGSTGADTCPALAAAREQEPSCVVAGRGSDGFPGGCRHCESSSFGWQSTSCAETSAADSVECQIKCRRSFRKASRPDRDRGRSPGAPLF